MDHIMSEKPSDRHQKSQAEIYLEQILPARKTAASLLFSFQRASSTVYRLGSPSCITNTRVQNSPSPDAAFTRKLDRKDTALEQLSSYMRLLSALESQATGLIDRYTCGRENRVLKLWYLSGYPWLRISQEVDSLSPKQLRRILRKGLSRIVLPEDAVWIRRRKTAA